MSQPRASVFVAVAVVVVSAAACITTVNSVKYERFTGAPVLQARGEGCSVDIVDDGTKFDRPHKEMGSVVLEWSATQMREQGPDYAMKTLRTAACEEGAHVVLNMRALPRGFNEGMVFEGVLAVLLDENGEPLAGKMTGTSVSHSGSSNDDVDAGPPAAGPVTP